VEWREEKERYTKARKSKTKLKMGEELEYGK
jgi:hypothetical protein